MFKGEVVNEDWRIETVARQYEKRLFREALTALAVIAFLPALIALIVVFLVIL